MSEQEKILIVDDNEANVTLIEAFLMGSDPNYILLKAYGGNEALELAKKERPDLILLDVMMPDLDGFQVCEKLRQDPSFAKMPIIIVTAKNQDEDIVQSLEKGADDYIIKPVNSEELNKKIRLLLSKAEKGKLPSQYYLEVQKARKEGKIKTLTDYSRLLNL